MWFLEKSGKGSGGLARSRHPGNSERSSKLENQAHYLSMKHSGEVCVHSVEGNAPPYEVLSIAR